MNQVRTRGRPQGKSDGLRERLLDVARDQFAASGHEATSLRQIASSAGVTPALAHYYFKDKDGLLDAVMHERIAPLIEGIQASLEVPRTGAAALAGFVQQFTLLASRHPWLPLLLLRDLADSPATAKLLAPLFARLQALVATGQQSGTIRSDLRAESIVLSVLSLCAFPFLAVSLRKELGVTAVAGSATAMTLHHLAVLQDGLKPRTRA